MSGFKWPSSAVFDHRVFENGVKSGQSVYCISSVLCVPLRRAVASPRKSIVD